ncbi:baseplate J/gp47 family protein, partial [Thiolapillus sp.]|uniref:baseplate J/gp47 family protein n=1 Tax=Thiolapillus sp. TaxID=2017437 RepID=UPI003AF9405C
MIYREKEDFEKLIHDAGIATTPEAMQKIWNQYNADQGSLISNDSSWSPFWRLISSIVTTPAMWLVNFLTTSLLPNSFLKTSSGKYLDLYAWGVGLERKPGRKAEGYLTFTRQVLTRVITIPAGTVVQSPSINGNVYQLQTLADATFQDMSSTLDVAVVALDVGVAFNLAPGYYVNMPVPIEGGVSVVNAEDWLSQPGSDDEHDDTLRLRCQNQFTSVGLFHHDAAYRSIIMDHINIRADYIWFEHGAPRGPGTANVYLMIDSGIAPDDMVADINRHINDGGYHG